VNDETWTLKLKST